MGRVFDVELTRPLSLVDVANRLIAMAIKRRWERRMSRWVSKFQRGFLPGRSMLANVIELESASLNASMEHRRPMAILVDFQAAFPSIRHRYMELVLEGIGLPPEQLRVLRTLYLDGHCVISAGGNTWPGFPMTSGIRQGCPLSPLLFAVVMDLLLRRLTTHLPGQHTHRAFADDVGLVITDLPAQLQPLVALLSEFGSISGMQVNRRKTIGIPLWLHEGELAREEIRGAAPLWGEIPLQSSATYLGCLIGPGKSGQEWSRALEKFLARIRGWKWAELGLYLPCWSITPTRSRYWLSSHRCVPLRRTLTRRSASVSDARLLGPVTGALRRICGC